MITPRYPLLNSSRMTRMARSGSWWRSSAGRLRAARLEMSSHWADRRLRSRASSSALAPSALDRGLVGASVVAVEDAVLRRADVDEGGLHAGQDLLHLAEVDVPVDLVRGVGGPGDVVLDQAPALEHGHLRGHPGPDGHAHQVTAGRPALPRAALAPLEGRLVELVEHRLDFRL